VRQTLSLVRLREGVVIVWGTRGRGFKSRRSDHFATACRSPLRFLQRPIKKRPRLYQIIEHALQFLAVLGARAIH